MIWASVHILRVLVDLGEFQTSGVAAKIGNAESFSTLIFLGFLFYTSFLIVLEEWHSGISFLTSFFVPVFDFPHVKSCDGSAASWPMSLKPQSAKSNPDPDSMGHHRVHDQFGQGLPSAPSAFSSIFKHV